MIVAGGDVAPRTAFDEAWPGWADGVGLVICADRGATAARLLGVPVDLVVGDADSVDPIELEELRRAGARVERSPAEKDASDTELAIEAALREGAGRLTVLGALGGPRLDHELANLALLSLPTLADREVTLLSGETRVRYCRGPVEIELAGRIGDIVSLLPVGGQATGVRTVGLRYPLVDEPLLPGSSRGLSNLRHRSDARVSFRAGHLFVVESVARIGRQP